MRKQTFLINTLIIVCSGFLVKILGLVNRIFIARLLGTTGMTLYIMAFPTIILFISMAGFNLNVAVSKLVSESLTNHRYSPRLLLKKSIKIGLVVSAIITVIFLILLRPLTYDWLKNANLFFPLLTTIILIPLVGISDTLRGFFNGLKMMAVSGFAQFLEQLGRIIFSIGSLLILLPYGIVVATSFCLLALAIGELCSIAFLVYRIKKVKIPHFTDTQDETKALIAIALPNTLAKLVGNITYFLEPIIYTFILSYLAYDTLAIQTEYTIINAYAIPLLSTASFLSFAIATALIPNVSESVAQGGVTSVNYYLQKSILFSLVPGIFVSLLLFKYPSEYMHLIYGTYVGADYIKRFVFLFLIYYLQPPITAFLQVLGKNKLLFAISSLFNFLRLALIIILAFVPAIGSNSIFYAILITMIGGTLFSFGYLLKYTKYRISFQNIINIAILTFLSYVILELCALLFPNSFLIPSLITGIIFLLLTQMLDLLRVKSLHDWQVPKKRAS